MNKVYKEYWLDSNAIKTIDKIKLMYPSTSKNKEYEIIQIALKLLQDILLNGNEWSRISIPQMQIIIRFKVDKIAMPREQTLFDSEVAAPEISKKKSKKK